MPKQIKPLTEIAVKNLKPKQKPDGTLVKNMVLVGGCPNLYCCVKPSGSKSWLLRPLIGTRRPEIGLGTYSGGKATRKKKSTGEQSTGMTLTAARKAGLKMLDDIKAGIDPLAEKRRKRSEAASKSVDVTFSELAQDYVQIKAATWKTTKQVSRLQQFLRDYINPVVGNILVSELEPAHFIAILKPIWATKTGTAQKIIRHCEHIVNLGIRRKLRPTGDNPARWQSGIDIEFPAPKRVHTVQHQRSVDWRLMPKFTPKLLELTHPVGAKPEAACLAFQILTIARPSEARLADWGEIDLEQKCWFIPKNDAELHKSEYEWTVPLTPLAIKILKAQGPKRSGLIFALDSGKAIPDNYVSCIPDSLGYDGVAHGFRSSFETWVQDAQVGRWSEDAVRLSMKHVNSDSTRAAYARGQCFDERVKLLKAWEDWITKAKGHTADVIPMRRRASK